MADKGEVLLLLADDEIWEERISLNLDNSVNANAEELNNSANDPLDVPPQIEMPAKEMFENNNETENSQVEDQSVNRNEAGIEENANSQYNIAVNLVARQNAFQSWQDYQIPWDKVSAYDLDQLNKGMKNDQLKTNVVKVIILT